MKQLDAFNDWYDSLQQRERVLVVATAITIVITLFYLIIWEPIHQGLADQQQQYESQQNNLLWIQQAAAEVRSLKLSGRGTRKVNSNKPVSLAIEQSISSAGLKNYLDKLESSGKNGARVKLNTINFDQMLIWLNTLEQHHGINVTSANIEKTDKPGIINARLSFEK